MKLSVRERETINNSKKRFLTPASCSITKASNSSHFHSSHFFAFCCPRQCQWFFLSVTFSHLRNSEKKIAFRVTIRLGQHHMSSAQQSWALLRGVRTWLGDRKRIPRVVIISSFFSFPFEGDIKDCRTPQPCVTCVMSCLLFLNYLFLISPCPHSRVYLQCRTIVQINSQTRRSNSSQFSWQ